MDSSKPTLVNPVRLEGLMASWPERDKAQMRTYVEEANFAFSIIEADLKALAPGSHVIEIGSGIGLLSLLIADSGFSVTSFEPCSSGFEKMTKYRNCILECLDGKVPTVRYIDSTFDRDYLRAQRLPTFAVAVNVLEHIPHWQTIVQDVLATIETRGKFRTIQPNSAWPYEPHYHIPTMISKKMTWKVLHPWIKASDRVENPIQHWKDLSWLTGAKLRESSQRNDLRAAFRRDASLAYLARFADDPEFRNRKGDATSRSVSLLSPYLRQLILALPASWLPILDCTFSLKPSHEL